MKTLTPETLYGNWATLLLATDGAGIVFSLPVNRTSFTLKPEKE